jgi:hypothetical protein
MSELVQGDCLGLVVDDDLHQLTLVLTDLGRVYLEDNIDHRTEQDEHGWTTWAQDPATLLRALLDDLYSAGWMLATDRELVALGALTSSPVILRDPNISDEGELVEVANVFWFPSYMVVDELAELLEHGYVVFPEAESAE